MNIALISPQLNAPSETFIQNHKEILPGKVFHYYGGSFPTKLEHVGSLSNIYTEDILSKIRRKVNQKKIEKENYLKQSFTKNKIDFIVSEFGVVGANVFPIAKELKIPMLTTWLGQEISGKKFLEEYELRYRKLLSSDLPQLVVSKTMIPTLVSLGANEDNITYSPLPPNNSFENCNPNYTAKNLLAIGRFVDKKAPYYLLFSLIEVLKIFPDTQLNIVGDGDLLNACKNITHILELEKSVNFLGIKNQDQVKELINNSSIFLQHSITALSGDSEGTPVAILEASLAGLPIISTKHAGIPDIINNGETGFLVEEHDIKSFSDKIIYLLKNPAKAKEMGENGKKFILENFSKRNHLDHLSNIIKEYIS